MARSSERLVVAESDPVTISAQEVLDALRAIAKRHIRAQASDWERHWLELVLRFQDLFCDMQTRMQQDLTAEEKFTAFEEMLLVTEKLIADVQIEPEAMVVENDLQSLHQQLTKRFAREESEWQVPLLPEDTALLPGDGVRTRWQKASWRNRMRMQKFRNSAGNFFLAVLHRAAKPLPTLYHRVNLPALLEIQVLAPVAQMMVVNWREQLHFGSQILEKLHQGCETLKRDWLSSTVLDDGQAHNLSCSQSANLVTDLRNELVQLKSLRNHPVLASFALQWQGIESEWQLRWKVHAATPGNKSRMITRRRQQLTMQIFKMRQAWHQHLKGVLSDWQKDVELALFQARLIQATLHTFRVIRMHWDEQIQPAFAEGTAILADSAQKFAKVNEKSADLKKIIAMENRVLLRKLRQQTLPALQQALQQAEFPEITDRIRETVQALLYNLPEEQSLFQKRDTDSVLPRSRVVQAPLRELINFSYVRRFNRHMERIKTDLTQQNTSLLTELSELDQIVEFNLDTGLSILESGRKRAHLEQAQKSVLEGMQRTVRLIENLQKKSENLVQSCESGLKKELGTLIEPLQDLGDNEQLLQLNLKLARAKTLESLRLFWQHALQKTQAGSRLAWQELSRVLKFGNQRYESLRRLAGLSQERVRIGDQLTSYLIGSEHSIERLPIIYQRLFSFDALDDQRFFVGREAVIKQLEQQLSAWQTGEFSAAVLVGEVGSGKTSVLNIARETLYADKKVLSFTLSDIVTSEDELTKILAELLELPGKDLTELESKLSQGEPLIIILEKLHHLYLRSVDGFQALERFLWFLTRTGKNIHWVLTCEATAWFYLDRVFSVNRYFDQVIELEGISTENLQSLILKRHRMSGFALDFVPPENIRKSRSYRRKRNRSARQAMILNRYFQQLREQSGGNLYVSLLYWLRSIERVDDEKLVIAPLNPFNHSFLYQLPLDELFTLSALVQSESLSADQHARVFRQAKRQSELILHRMSNTGILIENSGYYRLHPFLYRPIVRALTVKNILQM